ncbi:hypothetical protein CYLTODRAFT_495014 [Cylindrobasidium torrendii FP15055 ss-10]|uniref:CBF1-interacting co-repressor CIR N-terminal domain-containing protein n=1 Tax=Cylindrobasidium torrendii FP15055 ss-10 TaxID=1314674 RepID=A0A0D7AV01_9AGAR|nr:hypothetical protein CYLTODRAFT_495014 [Cylindrobasidium torrendii FP15055 ss-10]
MGKLNIAHHKSYHPYRRDNIEKVRRDEEEARLQEAKEEGRMMLADSEARMETLRQRAGLNKPAKKKVKASDDDDLKQAIASSSSQSQLTTTSGHINFFQDLEQGISTSATQFTKKKDPVDFDDRGVRMVQQKDLRPWYSKDGQETDEVDWKAEARRRRDTERKSSMHDPLTSITKQLASSSSSSHKTFTRPPPPKPRTDPANPPEVNARLSRESSERERAMALIRRKKMEALQDTPSTVHGGGSEYGDMYNRDAVSAAHRGRSNPYSHRRW